MKLIFDSNAFDDLINEKVNLENLINKGYKFYITHIQVDEINSCPDTEKRARLFNVMTKLKPENIPTESFVLGASRLNNAKLGDGELLEELRKDNLKNTSDALIGETAIKNDLILITADKKFKKRIIELGGNALTISDL